MLRYVSAEEVMEGSALIGRIDDEVDSIYWRNRGTSMLLDTQTMLKQEARMQGRIQGRGEGEGRLAKFVALPLDLARIDDVRLAVAPAAARERLFGGFGL